MEEKAYKVTLTAARVNAGLTQTDACKKIGISKATLGSYESGKTSPTIPTLKTICRVYKVPMDSILFTHDAN